ncbi:MAG: glutathione S-transferase [Robiginitomaculum sp.]|nr:MAG: glutathione S-transferase [Robiginitomaculum sp.]
MLKLYIGNKNYSSWSMRPWLVLKKAELPFEEKLIPLYVPGVKEKLLELSSAGTVPVLQVPEAMIPDSLAISEWAAKCVPNLWPKDPVDRKAARAFCQQMQDDYGEFRNAAPMNLRRRTSNPLPKAALHAAQRMQNRWQEFLGGHEDAFLFGDWSIADAFATPYATRFMSYGIPRDPRADTYISELMADEHFLGWEIAALAEEWVIEPVEAAGR